MGRMYTPRITDIKWSSSKDNQEGGEESLKVGKCKGTYFKLPFKTTQGKQTPERGHK